MGKASDVVQAAQAEHAQAADAYCDCEEQLFDLERILTAELARCDRGHAMELEQAVRWAKMAPTQLLEEAIKAFQQQGNVFDAGVWTTCAGLWNLRGSENGAAVVFQSFLASLRRP